MLRDSLQPDPLEEVSCRHLSVLQIFVTCLADNNCLMQGNCLIFAILDHQTIGLQAGIERKTVSRDSDIHRFLIFALQTFARTLLHFQTSSVSRMQLLPKRDPACVSHCVHVCVRNLESYVRMGHNRLVQTWLKTITIALSHNRLCLTIFVGSITFVFLLQRDIFFPRLPLFVTPFLFGCK
jgi:hypothetical protein